MKILFFLLISSLIIFSTQSRSIISRPQPLSSPRIDTIQGQGNCSYIVNILTTFSSPSTRDSISLRFGDANGNEVFAPNIDDPDSGRFQPGSWNVLVLNGPCMNRTICYLFLYRSGDDGWIPYDVFILQHLANFYFNVRIPNNGWFGYNKCFPPPPANATSLAVK
ncbi:hypothetical protein CDL12_14806 [Handroanthus impetiginosus]|uniref:Uncharacterized protein n=1 Tax=Handroanthus impetiginosus TaxID=429701 RepID=A0A2G9H5I5_9LAMI|nr:hypothetical protein CDL12_14806 [Handroanthus impetiginosus]